jgi:peptidoglycan/xylan/chitin deacetylase (PgdA/CDA1 family)
MKLFRQASDPALSQHCLDQRRLKQTVTHLLIASLALLPQPAFSSANSVAPPVPEPTAGELPLEPPVPVAETAPAAPGLTCASDAAVAVAETLPPVQTSLLDTLAPMLVAQFSARPFPEIHDRARSAKVPVIMYHDILPEKQVFFDVTPAEFEADLQLIRDSGLTPISLDQLNSHLATGIPLPEKPILLTFDDGYEGHYTYVLPLLRQYGYPGAFGIYTSKVGSSIGRSSLSWEQLREMAADPLVTIASHSISHPPDLGVLPAEHLRREVVESKRILETELGISIDHFVYPEGNYNAQVQHWAKLAGYRSALTMNDAENRFAGDSIDLLSIDRIGQSQLESVIAEAYGGPSLPPVGQSFNPDAPIRLNKITLEETPLILISGGRPITIHADSRYQVPEILARAAETRAVAAVDGAFFSLKYLDSNVMIGPILSQSTKLFVPGNASENPLLTGRPLVLIARDHVTFVPFDPDRHNTLAGIQSEEPEVTDAFVAAAWLVKDSQPQPPSAFGDLFDFDAARHRAFWGIDQSGQPVIGVASEPVGSVDLGKLLSRAGLRDAVMLDSGASTSLAFNGESLVGYTPRPVPHVVALVPPEGAADCLLVAQDQAKE